MEPKICRICLDSPGVVPLFVNQDELLSSKMMQCVNISVVQDDGLPDHICMTCESELAITYNFIKKCEASDKTLRLREVKVENCKEEFDEKSEIKIKNEDEESLYGESFPNDDFLLEEDQTLEIYKKSKKKTKKKSRVYKGSVECFNCGLKFHSEAALKIHKRTHTGEKPYPCPNCDKRFTRESNLERHQLLHTRGRKKYTRKHFIKVEPFPCKVCGLMMKSHSTAAIHARSHSNERPFPCSICGKRFKFKGCLKRHNETNHLKPGERERRFTCEMCGRSFYRKADIIMHIGTHTGVKPHACTQCPMRFLQIAALIRHRRTHTGDRPFPCLLCGKRFADRTLVSKHMSVHSDERNYKCQVCGKALKCKSSLYTHLKIHTNHKDIICSFCGLTFSTRGNLGAHTRRIHSEASGQCTICMKPFPDLTTHMRKHTGEKPFNCEQCGRSFATKISLSHHISFKHENQHKYKCSIGECTKTFPIPSMLEFHLLKQHTNHTPHVCQYCARGFYRISDLSRHLKMTHNIDSGVVVKIKPPID